MNTDTPRTNQAVLQSDGQWSFVLRDCSQELERELTAITEQRDRLAEAVNAATILIAAKGRHNTMLAYEGLRDVIQSLNQPTQ
jgi:hypothetical protein